MEILYVLKLKDVKWGFIDVSGLQATSYGREKAALTQRYNLIAELPIWVKPPPLCFHQ